MKWLKPVTGKVQHLMLTPIDETLAARTSYCGRYFLVASTKRSMARKCRNCQRAAHKARDNT